MVINDNMKMKEKNILAITGIITIVLAILLEIFYVIIVSINKDFKYFYLLGMCVALIGFIFCIIAITKRNIYKKNYNIITYIMIFISAILINVMPIVDRIIGVPVEEDCCDMLDTTIDWNADE